MRRVLALGLLLTLNACAVGLQQSVALPFVHGNWTYSGTDAVVSDPVSGGTLPIHVGAESGQLDLNTMTQILLALDLPFLRMSMAPALLGRNDIEYIQADFLYKHLMIEQPGRRWWLLAGLGAVILNSGLKTTLSPTRTATISGQTLTPNDTVNYEARHNASGGYLAVGAQAELTGWLHFYAELLMRFSHSESQSETANIVTGQNTLNLLQSSLHWERTKTGVTTADYTTPVVLLAVGVHFSLPSYHLVRRLISWHGGNPALDDAPPSLPEPVTPETLPQDVTQP